MSAAGAPPGPERLPNAGPAGPSFPAGATTRVPSAAAPAAPRASGSVLERAERLRERHERDTRRVVGVPVAVGIDHPVEAREDLVGPGEERVAAGGILLPAADADRQHRRAGRDTGDARPSGPDDDARHLRPVPLRDTVGTRPRPRVDAPAGDVQAGQHMAVQVGGAEVDARVQQADEDAAAVEPDER